MYKVLEIYSIPRLNQEEVKNMNIIIISSETESEIKKENTLKQSSKTRHLHA